MGFLDDLGGIWNDVNAFLQPVAEFIDPFADLIPGFQAAQNILGIDPSKWNDPSGNTVFRSLPTTPVPTARIFAESGPVLGGATMDFSGFVLTTTGMRGLVPFQGQGPPAPGYHLARRTGRRPQAGRNPGMYWVPRRTMNPLNPRALMRAERRMAGFTKYVKRHFSLISVMPKRKKASRPFARKRRCK